MVYTPVRLILHLSQDGSILWYRKNEQKEVKGYKEKTRRKKIRLFSAKNVYIFYFSHFVLEMNAGFGGLKGLKIILKAWLISVGAF